MRVKNVSFLLLVSISLLSPEVFTQGRGLVTISGHIRKPTQLEQGSKAAAELKGYCSLESDVKLNTGLIHWVPMDRTGLNRG